MKFSNMENKLFILLGPTGIGKTDLSIEVAKKLECPVISCDSRQFYKEMNIGTAVPKEEQLMLVKHYFIRNKSIHEYYNVYEYEKEAIELINMLFESHNDLLMVGGSGLFIDVIVHGIDDIPDIDLELRQQIIKKYEKEGIDSLRFDLRKMDPEYYSLVDLRNKNRMLRAIEVKMQTGKTLSSFRKNNRKVRDFNIVKIGLETDREVLYNRINQRTTFMVEEGLLEEARALYPFRNLNALNTVGYKEFFDYFDGKISLQKAVELISRNTRRYAKRQITWFRRDTDIKWFQANDTASVLSYIENERANRQ